MHRALIAGAGLLALLACQPKVQVEAPKEPIIINLNIRHEVYVKVDKEVEDLLDENEELFGGSQ